MVTKVVIELQPWADVCAEPGEVQKTLAPHGIDVQVVDGKIVAWVHDSHDAEDEVADALSEAGIRAYVIEVE